MIALDQMEAAHAAGIAPGVVLMDAGYGCDTELRAGITGLGTELCGRHPVADRGMAAGSGTASAEALYAGVAAGRPGCVATTPTSRCRSRSWP